MTRAQSRFNADRYVLIPICNHPAITLVVFKHTLSMTQYEGLISSQLSSQGIERKRNSDVYQEP